MTPLPFLANLLAHYHWQLSLVTAVAIAAVTVAGSWLMRRVPAIGEASRLNKDTLRKKMERPAYAANQQWNRKWFPLYLVVEFGVVLPFCLTADAKPWWAVLLDIVVILMVYDFFYYLIHRFLFHSGSFLGGRLLQVHAVHHRQHNPCRMDSSYIHPVEVAMGLGLYLVTIAVLALAMGPFHVATIVATFVAFSQVNLHNHTLWQADRFPFRYLHYASKMHHNHHARFDAGNFATITLLFDWLFGTIDHGAGYKAKPKAGRPSPAATA